MCINTFLRKSVFFCVVFVYFSSVFFSRAILTAYAVTGGTFTQTDWSGGWGQTNWSDATKYNSESGINTFVSGQATLNPSSFATLYNATGTEIFLGIRKTSDGGMAFAGNTTSFHSGGDFDFFLTKTDDAGVVEWQKLYRNAGNEFFYSMQQTSDGGYILAGQTDSNDADGDVFAIKTDSQGEIVWQKTYGGTAADFASSVIETSDGGFVFYGATKSYGTGIPAQYNIIVIKVNSSGDVAWQYVYGGTAMDMPNTPDLIKQTSDGGYVFACDSVSFSGASDLWVVKLNSLGVIEWQKVYHGLGGGASGVVVLSGGGYLIGGDVNSFGAGDFDYWILQLTSSGEIVWQKTYGGAAYDANVNLIETSHGDYFASGNAKSFGAGDQDVWAMRLDTSGNILWQKAYGGTGTEHVFGIPQEMNDGSFIMGAYSSSTFTEDYSPWILKVAPDGTIGTSSSQLENTTTTPLTGTGYVSSTVATITTSTASATTTAATTSTSSFTASSTSSSGGGDYVSSGTLASSLFNSGVSYTMWGPLSYAGTVPTTTDLSFEVSVDGGGSWDAVTNYTTQTFGPAQTFAYRATLSSDDNLSTPTLTSVSVIYQNIPSDPSGLAISNVVAGSSLKLTWTDNAQNEDGFEIESSNDAITYTQIATTTANTLEYTVSPLALSTRYYFRVRAYNASGNSGYTTAYYSGGVGEGGSEPQAYNPPAQPSGGFSVVVNDGATTTTNKIVTLKFNGGSEATHVSISNSNDFSLSPKESYALTKEWNLCPSGNCLSGTRTVYVKFFNAYGLSSPVVSDSIYLDITSVSQNLLCQPYLMSYIKWGSANKNDDVTKLQKFLRDYEGFSSLALSGIYDKATYDAIIIFQEKYAKDILTPWGFSKGTGYVYITTIQKINSLYCSYQNLSLSLSREQILQKINELQTLLSSLRARLAQQ